MDPELYLSSDSNFRQVSVKTESPPSPDLLPASASLQPHYPLSFPSKYHSSHFLAQPPAQQSLVRFGASSHPTALSPPMAFSRQWPTGQSPSSSASVPKYDIDLDNAMSFDDDYNDMSDLAEVDHGASDSTHILESRNLLKGEKILVISAESPNANVKGHLGPMSLVGTAFSLELVGNVRPIVRVWSNFIYVACTFLGPSRKRGPPKGYIDAIEARLHQTEALLGIVLASGDERADTLIRDLSQVRVSQILERFPSLLFLRRKQQRILVKDPLAREIINRVDNSPYGVKGRNGGDRASGKSRYAVAAAADAKDGDSAKAKLASTHPSNEWQDRVTAMLRSFKQSTANGSEDSFDPARRKTVTQSLTVQDTRLKDHVPVTIMDSPSGISSDGGASPGRRQRRRVDEFDDGDHSREKPGYQSASAPVSTVSTPVASALSSQWPSSASSTNSSPGIPPKDFLGRRSSHPGISSALSLGSRDSQSQFGGLKTDITPTARRPMPNVLSEESCSLEDDEELTDAVGELSLTEEEQVRYHGKVSGLHLLGSRDRIDHRNQGGIWRFPKAGVWPPSPSISRSLSEDEERLSYLPPAELQEHLLDVYFRVVHPSFPVIHKRLFYDALCSGPPTLYSDTPPSMSQAQTLDSDSHTTSSRSSSSSPYNSRPRRVPALLLFAIFSVAARYSNHPSIPSKPSIYSSAGDHYLEQAIKILDKVYTNPRPSTCQALLVMGYQEVGVASMTRGWSFVGMAIRMAQDLGMHRSADRWTRLGLGGRLFGDQELQERRRIWYGCVIMDKYVSAYIGRPLMIFERDFDTALPSVNDLEEMEEIQTDESSAPVRGRIISCFNAAAGLSGILSMIIQAVYAVRPVSSSHGEAVYLEQILAKWYHELPEHLQHPLSFKHSAPLPHVLTLHLQYWCAVLLLHRPFVRTSSCENPEHSSANTREGEDASITRGKSYELCSGAANHITSIASLYMERYSLDCCPVFLCYYVFTAGLMHVTTVSTFPKDPQGRLGFQKCLDLLKAMGIVWPSADCAFELLRGANVDLEIIDQPAFAPLAISHKRSLDNADTGDERYDALNELQYPPSSPSSVGSFSRHQQPFYNQQVHSYPNNLHSPTPTFYTYTTPTNYQQHWVPETQPQFDNTLYDGTVPQNHSYGLVEDRVPAMGRPTNHHNNSNELWNDYHSSVPHQTGYPATMSVHHTSSSHSFHSQESYSL
ncbi:hypothetical protein D9758_002493 [Tetrapyrgos nigripes]|uniref:Xylanolytic transcriptional activator regulatory domain-containing protein n=1 Tax=Tetrapyrgos nigripes TaxID=182062 RepID=A0A8H5LU22_9AGAR|nr:hypothetical protein D9758_002493 [Tetrapyrgos nigripes]